MVAGVQSEDRPRPHLPDYGLPETIADRDIDATKAVILERFADVFSDAPELRPMAGPPMHIHLMDGAVPFAIRAARTIPLHYEQATKKALDDQVKVGIIVKHDGPSDWVHPMVVVPKKQGVRITVDFTKLNRFVRRPVHPVLATADALAKVPAGARYFTTLDAKSGYCLLYTSPSPRDS